MEEHEIYLKRDTKYLQIPIEDHSSIFLKRYSSELKYMAPWTQYDDGFSEENIYSDKKMQQQINVVDKSIKKEENDKKYFIGLEKHPL